jgi:hypothetical protein
MNENTKQIIDQIQETIGEDVEIFHMSVTDEMRARFAQFINAVEDAE